MDESLPEFAFIGRSNVGKSSLLNMLSGREDLARVSATPGHTKLINFFTMNQTWRLVDLPGYGFAQAARRDRSSFNRAVADYLEHRANLCCVFALIDSGLPPQEMDLEFVQWLTSKAVPFVLVFTKCDRVTPTVLRANLAEFTARISGWYEKPPAVFTCSARTRQGREELLAVIEESIGAAGDQARQRPPDATRPPDDPASPQRTVKGRKPPGQRPW